MAWTYATSGGECTQRDSTSCGLRTPLRALTATSHRDFAGNDLLKEFWSNRSLARKRATVSGDEQHGQCNACCKERQCYTARKPIVAVNHGNRNQGAKSLKQNARPFDRADGSLADYNALASSI